MQQVLRPEPQKQPELQQALRHMRTIYGLFWTLAGTTVCLYNGPLTFLNVGMSSWFGLATGLFAVGLYDSLVPTGKEQLEKT